MRFILVIILLAVAIGIGLYVFGGMVEPQTTLIEEEATGLTNGDE